MPTRAQGIPLGGNKIGRQCEYKANTVDFYRIARGGSVRHPLERRLVLYDDAFGSFERCGFRIADHPGSIQPPISMSQSSGTLGRSSLKKFTRKTT
jgi:hypothetical protein